MAHSIFIFQVNNFVLNITYAMLDQIYFHTIWACRSDYQVREWVLAGNSWSLCRSNTAQHKDQLIMLKCLLCPSAAMLETVKMFLLFKPEALRREGLALSASKNAAQQEQDISTARTQECLIQSKYLHNSRWLFSFTKPQKGCKIPHHFLES